jgi:hypothetical protein
MGEIYMNKIVEMGSVATIYLPSLKQTDSGIQKLIVGNS